MTSTTATASQAMHNTRPRTQWGELPGTVRRALESAAGPVRGVEPISAGLNCGIAALLHTTTQTVFIKGLRSDHPRIATQRREAQINPYVAPIAPRLLWQLERDGWTILAFEHLNGRHADLTPGSTDLPKLAETLRRLGQIRCPDLPLRRLEDRWAGLVNDSALHLLAGDSLLHTDLNPYNILIGEQARIVDWAWPTLGAAWVDPACAALWLIAEGHTPPAAEAWAAQIPSWTAASRHGIDAFTAASCRLWEQIAHDDPQPWKLRLHAAAQAWAEHRRISPRDCHCGVN
ncbi:MAG: phosphotransferase family protein [Pseudonocardiaceae bacterium]